MAEVYHESGNPVGGSTQEGVNGKLHVTAWHGEGKREERGRCAGRSGRLGVAVVEMGAAYPTGGVRRVGCVFFLCNPVTVYTLVVLVVF